ncbi:MAG: histidinol dehydrogenase, partial [Gemmatimonadota bacterium]|nr:histidinol dehydrogenase [Gemmatimonadota bacterium]
MSLPILSGRRASDWVRARTASPAPGPDVARVRDILERVRADGDEALLELGERLDGVRPVSLRVEPARIRDAADRLSPDRRRALGRARRNLERFHAAQRRSEPAVPIEDGVRAWREFRPIRRVGVYVPGGRAPYPSSLLMAVIPARIAGCAEIAVCSP